MDCPVCKNTTLVMSDRQGIEIDYCPNCRGVWLDRGELDKLIDRSLSLTPQAAPQQPVRQEAPQQQPHQSHQAQGSGRSYSSYEHGDKGYRKKKRGGFLGELFDFD